MKSGEFNILYSKELETSIAHLDNTSEIFSLQLTKDCFLEIIENHNSTFDFRHRISTSKSTLFLNRWFHTNGRIEQCINDMLTCSFQTELRQLYLRAKAIELLVLVVDLSCNHAEDKLPPGIIKNRSDQEKLREVREFLINSFAEPVCLDNLCKNFGLNEFKLKVGFKELYGTSVIDFLISQRLEQARILLQEKAMRVSEIAYACGYSSPQYFSIAFKKKFGYSPTDKG